MEVLIMREKKIEKNSCDFTDCAIAEYSILVSVACAHYENNSVEFYFFYLVADYSTHNPI